MKPSRLGLVIYIGIIIFVIFLLLKGCKEKPKPEPLKPDTKYFYRAIADNKDGVATGMTYSFKTPKETIIEKLTKFPGFVNITKGEGDYQGKWDIYCILNEHHLWGKGPTLEAAYAEIVKQREELCEKFPQ